MEQTNKSQTATSPEIDPESGKKLRWKDKVLYKTPKGTFIYLTKREKTIAKKIEKMFEEGKLTNVVSKGALNQFFKQRYILGLNSEEGFFAKQYYKSYILDFEKYNKDKDIRQRRRRLQIEGEGSE
jgi:hypothetical protein